MTIQDKENALYVRGVVIAPDMVDLNDDPTPDAEGIKKIFSNYLQHQSDIQHNFINQLNIYQLENTVTTTETNLNGVTVPKGSWIASHMVLNDSVIAMIKDNTLTGYSLGAVGKPDEQITNNEGFLNKSLRYEQLNDYDDLNPLFISFVDKPSNGFIWEVMDYNNFLAKSEDGLFSNDYFLSKSVMEDDGLTETNETQKIDELNVGEETVKVSVVERLLAPFMVKAETSTKEEDEKEKDEPVADGSEPQKEEDEEELKKAEITLDDVAAAIDELPAKISEAVITALDEYAKNKESPQKEDKPEGDVLEKSEDTGNVEGEALTKSEDDKESEDVKVMTKSAAKLDEIKNTTNDTPRVHFLDNEKRDEFGRVRKYLK